MMRTTVALECDSCGSRQYARVPNGRSPVSVFRALRKRLAAIGWRNETSFGDTCPRCSS